MLNFDCKNVSKDVIGEANGLDLNAVFNDYQEKIKDSGRELMIDENCKQKTWKDFVITNKDQENFEILKSLEKETEISLGYDCASEMVIN